MMKTWPQFVLGLRLLWAAVLSMRAAVLLPLFCATASAQYDPPAQYQYYSPSPPAQYQQYYPPPSVAPPLPPTTYCDNSACGANLLGMGWNLLSEFGSLSPSRFGGYQINTIQGFSEDSWESFLGGSICCVDYYSDRVSNEVLQWFGGSGDSGEQSRVGFQKSIPQNTQRVLVAWGGFSATCTMTILNADGVELFRADHNTAYLPMATNLRLDEVNVDMSNGKGKIRFEEYGWGICWTF